MRLGRAHVGAYVFAGDAVNDVGRRVANQFGNDRELVDVILSREQRRTGNHLGEDTANTPDVNGHIVLLPRKHNFGSTVVTSGDVSSHERILDTSQTKVADLEIAVLVNENVAGLQITMNDSSRVDKLEGTLLIELR